MPVWHPEFGIFKSEREEQRALDELLHGLLELKKVITPSELHIILTERYERIYGIRDHSQHDPDNHFQLVAFNHKDDYAPTNPLHEIEKKYIVDRVYHHTGIPLHVFLDLPRYDIERYFKFCAELNEKENAALANLRASMNNTKAQTPTNQYSFKPPSMNKPSRRK